jgi:hypothetical protein
MIQSDLVKDSLKQSVGSQILFFLNNGYRFEGKILACDDFYLKYFDSKKNCIRLQKIEEIREVEIK